MSQLEKSKTSELTSIVLAVLFIGILLAVCFYVLQPFLAALIWASMIVIASWQLMLKVQKILWNRRSLAVLVMTLAQIMVLMVPLIIAVVTIADNADIVVDKAREFISKGLPPVPAWLAGLPLVGDHIQTAWSKLSSFGANEALTKALPYLGRGVAWVVDQAAGFGKVLVHFILTIILSALLYAKGEQGANQVRRFAKRLAEEQGEKAVILAAQAIRAVANGVILTALVQALMTGIGLLLAGIPYAAVLSSVTFLSCVIQLGAAPILIGSIIYLFNYSSPTIAWIFLVWGLAIMLIDNFLRPFLIKRGADLPLILIFAGVIGGLLSFGIIGIFVGPVVLAVSYTLLQAWISSERNGRERNGKVYRAEESD